MKTCIGPAGRSTPALSGLPGLIFRGAPLLGWLAAWAIKDLHRPDSRIKDIVRRLAEKAAINHRPVVSVEPTAALIGPDTQNRHNGSNT